MLPEITETILRVKSAKNLTFAELATKVGCDPVFLATACYRQASLSHEQAIKLLEANRELVVENAEAAPEEPLLHLYNGIAERSGHLLLTASAAPARWGVALADLPRGTTLQTAVLDHIGRGGHWYVQPGWLDFDGR